MENKVKKKNILKKFSNKKYNVKSLLSTKIRR